MATTIATVAVRRYIPIDARAIRLGGSAVSRLVIQPEDNSTGPVYIPYSPSEIQHSNLGSDYATPDRVARQPALIYMNQQLPKMSFDLNVVDKVVNIGAGGGFHALSGGGFLTVQSAMQTITTLQDFARLGIRLKVTYGALESGTWRITSFSVQSLRRDQANNEITQATVSLEFTKVSDVKTGIGPITGGVSPPPSTTPPAAAPARTYVVKKGDTLYAISIKYYGTGAKWRTIADANGIKDPRKLQIGTRLRIP